MKELEAYLTMFQFLQDRYQHLPSDDLGNLLGELRLAADGLPFDPAIEEEWNGAVAAVRRARNEAAAESLRKAS